uniref:Uncharacterized protein n=1 Tax=Oryza nivara TaxID=4536 RepID=A0A0E0G7V8_ORYNI
MADGAAAALERWEREERVRVERRRRLGGYDAPHTHAGFDTDEILGINTDTSRTRIRPCPIRVRIRSRVGHRHAPALPYQCFIGIDRYLMPGTQDTGWYLGIRPWYKVSSMILVGYQRVP